jgi:hypothetical protein
MSLAKLRRCRHGESTSLQADDLFEVRTPPYACSRQPAGVGKNHAVVRGLQACGRAHGKCARLL